MARIYATLVEHKEWKLEDVPEKWREEVERIIEEDKKKAQNQSF